MKVVFSSALALAALGAGAQRPPSMPEAPPRPPLRQAVPWKPSRISPLSIAKAADGKVAALRGVQGQTASYYWFGPDFGQMGGLVKIRDSKTFSLEYPSLHYRQYPGDLPARKYFIFSNGREAQLSGYLAKTRKVPLSKFRFDSSKTVSDWALKFPLNIFGGIRREAPITHLVTMATRSNSGFKVTSNERSLPYRGMMVAQRQILIQRTAAAAKISGPMRIELNFDVQRGLPVSVRVDTKEKGRPDTTVAWSIHWLLTPTKFPDSDFKHRIE